MATVALVGTLDTKGQDFAFLAARLRAAGAEVIVIDAGTHRGGARPEQNGGPAWHWEVPLGDVLASRSVPA